MILAARELALHAAAKARAPILARARQLREQTGQPRDWRLDPPLILGAGERV